MLWTRQSLAYCKLFLPGPIAEAGEIESGSPFCR
jgi:hypothetical protein